MLSSFHKSRVAANFSATFASAAGSEAATGWIRALACKNPDSQGLIPFSCLASELANGEVDIFEGQI